MPGLFSEGGKEKLPKNAHEDFFVKWGVQPIPYWLANDVTFRSVLERSLSRKGRAASVTVFPWTTKAEALGQYDKAIGSLHGTKAFRGLDLEKLRRDLLPDYITKFPFPFEWITYGDLAQSIGDRGKKGKGLKKKGMNDRELDKADQLLHRNLKKGLPYGKADWRASRQVTKKRWKEPQSTAKIRMRSRRAFKTLKDLLSL